MELYWRSSHHRLGCVHCRTALLRHEVAEHLPRECRRGDEGTVQQTWIFYDVINHCRVWTFTSTASQPILSSPMDTVGMKTTKNNKTEFVNYL